MPNGILKPKNSMEDSILTVLDPAVRVQGRKADRAQGGNPVVRVRGGNNRVRQGIFSPIRHLDKGNVCRSQSELIFKIEQSFSIGDAPAPGLANKQENL